MYFLRKLIIELNSATLNDGRNKNEIREVCECEFPPGLHPPSLP